MECLCNANSFRKAAGTRECAGERKCNLWNAR